MKTESLEEPILDATGLVANEPEPDALPGADAVASIPVFSMVTHPPDIV